MSVLLIRHAETDLAGRFCGWADPPVNARGLAQIAAMVDGLTDGVEVVYASDLERARTTAEAIAARFGAPLRLTAELREIGFGEWEGLAWEEIERRDPELARRWVEEFPRVTAPGGEAFEVFAARVLREFDAICARGEDAALVTHAGVLRVILTRRCEWSEERAWAETKAYCCVFAYPMGVAA